MARRIHGAWYALTAAPIALGAAIAAWAVMGMVDEIEAMPRLEVPGERDLELQAREYIVYGETKSVVDGHGISVSSFDARCSLTDAGTGEPLTLATRSSSTSYTLGSYKGESVWEVDVPHSGTYHLACEGGPGVIAFGGGIGGAIAKILVAVFGSIGLSIVVFFLVRRRRKG